MTKAPKWIWTCNETRNIWISCEQEDTTTYVRADLHAELMRAADELAEAVDQERNMVCQDFGMQLKASEVVDTALTAYQQAKEKLNATV